MVRVEDSACDCLFVSAASHDELAFLALHDCSARVLTHGQYAAGCNARVLQQVECNKAVVRACFGVGQNLAELCEVFGAQQMCDIAHCGLRQKRECFWCHLQERAKRCLHLRDTFGADEAVLGGVRTKGEYF